MNVFRTSLFLLTAILLLVSCGPNPGGGSEQGLDDSIRADARVLALPTDAQAPAQPQPLNTALPVGVERLTWVQLKDVSFEETWYPELEQYLLFPTFGESLRARVGQRFLISGYVIPVDPGDENRPARYVLSANPFSACFFCGNAGPESVVELELKKPDQLFATDEFRSFWGVFSLNDKDVDRLNYLLQDAELK